MYRSPRVMSTHYHFSLVEERGERYLSLTLDHNPDMRIKFLISHQDCYVYSRLAGGILPESLVEFMEGKTIIAHGPEDSGWYVRDPDTGANFFLPGIYEMAKFFSYVAGYMAQVLYDIR